MRLKHIDALRAFAAIIVTFFHLSGSSGLSNNVASAGKYGSLGVEIFFVISGFVLPYSLMKANYTAADFKIFMLKRIIRIYPAYIAAIFLSILMALIVKRPLIPWVPTLTHLFLLNSILGFKWISAVFWTLSIEFQFYILIGLLYSIISTSNIKCAVILLLLAVSAFVIKSPVYLLHWFTFFGLGILIYKRRFFGMALTHFWLSVFAMLVICFFVTNLAETLAGVTAFLFIMFVKMEKKNRLASILSWAGMISYSLYLVHWEVGRAAVSISRHIPGIGAGEILRLGIGMFISILTASIFYKFIEKPSVAWSAKIKYKREQN